MSEIQGRVEDNEPHWRVSDTLTLTRHIAGVCNIRQEVAKQIVTEMLGSESKTAQFETQTVLAGKPNLSRTRSLWEAREVTWRGISSYTAYELRRISRTEG